MQQATDFLEESEVLLALVKDLADQDFERATLFKQWTINDVFVHLHFWNLGADMALNEPDRFTMMFEELHGALKAGKLRDYENTKIEVRGKELISIWENLFRDMGDRWLKVDPKTRVKWAGPDMSVRTSISARQMEVWAHGQAIFDLMGCDRPEADRIKNIVMLGVNAFGWSHKVHGMEIPDKMPALELVAPSGEVWKFGEDNGCISGSASEFCQVVTQTRNIADTSLAVSGTVAGTWMANAQCFAGPPETPPAPGTRFKSRGLHH
ncbi:MAG: TIGR03084 family metal-binding protein [Pseudomonadota bacterium]